MVDGPDLGHPFAFGVDLGLDPERLYRVLSVIVTTNMFGDILSNEAAAIVGGLGFAPSLNVAANDSFALAQASHGSAPGYRRHGTANPTAMLLSITMLLDWIGSVEYQEPLRALAAEIDASLGRALADFRASEAPIRLQSLTDAVLAAGAQ